ncbi:MAG TPA: PQQ-binding-like beta-propeller repeat protein [Streptosporangiaceae bacterium]
MPRPLHTALSAVLISAGLAFPASAGTVALARPASTPAANWSAFLAGPAHRSFNAGAAAITPGKVPGLKRIWTFFPAAATMPGQPGPRLFSSPTVFSGRVYIGANTGVFYALSEATGKVIWSRFLGFVTKKTCGARGFTSTATVAADPKTGKATVYVAAADGFLYALNAATGSTKWRSLVARPSSSQNNYYNWSSPTVVRGRIYMGVSSQCDSPLSMGGLREFSQATGAHVAFFKTNPPGPTGPSIWSSAAAPSSGTSVYVTTGNGLGPNQISVIRLNGTSLARQGGWQIPAVAHGFDSDFGGSATLFSARIGGRSTLLVGACNKNGVYYTLRRGDLKAGPVWQFLAGSEVSVSNRCNGAAAWDGSRLYIAANQTVIGGTTFNGSVRSLNPATGKPIWATGLPDPVVGSLTVDGGGVLAVPTFGDSGLFLVAASTGQILLNIPTGPEFGQPVFAGNMLLAPTRNHGLWAYTPSG